MRKTSSKLRSGDFVEVKPPEEILLTLDGEGALDGLPFMPEMIEFCGKQFQISKRVVKTCTSGTKAGSSMRVFRTDDVVLLEGLRCSGADHDGCQKACNIFWRETWLRKIQNPETPVIQANGVERLRARLTTIIGPNKYFCQSSEILNATVELSKLERFSKCVDEVWSRNTGTLEVVRRISIWTFWKVRRALFGPYAKGKNHIT